MSKQPDAGAAELDADGLVVQKYNSMVLVVVPERDFGDEALRYARSSLYNVHVGTWAVSSTANAEIKGRLQDFFLPDGDLASARMEGFSGVIFVGGEGAMTLASHPDALRIAREASQAGKMIGAWGHAIAILANAGVVKGQRVTGALELRETVEKAGGKFTGAEIEICGRVVTARDDAVGMRFGKALAAIVGIGAR
jgi:putative intracellular protease/amidase